METNQDDDNSPIDDRGKREPNNRETNQDDDNTPMVDRGKWEPSRFKVESWIELATKIESEKAVLTP